MRALKSQLTVEQLSTGGCWNLPKKSLLVSSIRAQTEKAKRTIVLQQLKQKPQYGKLISMKKQKIMSHVKGQDKTPEKHLNKVEIGILPEEEFRIMIVKMIQDLGKSMEAKIKKMQEMFTKDLEELKNKQMSDTLEGINSRITEAEERINDLEDRMVEITAAEQIIEKKNEKK